MTALTHLLSALRGALTTNTEAERDEAYLSQAVDHADLERRLASQARLFMALSLASVGR
jgi:hypothetical protein